MRKKYTNKVGGYKYIKTNIPVMASSLIKVHYVHASQPNLSDIMTGIEKLLLLIIILFILNMQHFH